MKENFVSRLKAKANSVDRTTLGFVTILIGLALAAYGQILNGYFSTDEWWAFSFAIAKQSLAELLAPEGVYAPGANLFIAFLYRTFGLNALPWAIIALSLHLANTVIVYGLTTRLTKDRLIGLVTAGLFTILPMGSQFLHQFSMMPTSAVATFFALLSTLAYSCQRPIIAAILIFISLIFSPYVVPFIALCLLVEFVFFERKKWFLSIKRYLPVLAAFGLYLFMTYRKSFGARELHDRPISGDSPLTDRLQAIGQKIYQGYGELITHYAGTIDANAMIRYSSLIVFLTLIGIGLLLWRKQYRLAKVTTLGLLWIPISLSLFSTLNTVSTDATYPSRYFYVTTIGLGLLIAPIVIGLLSFPFSYKKISASLGQIILIVILLCLLQFYLPETRRIVRDEVKLGQTREGIMKTITHSVPGPLGRDALFCFTSNTGHYAASRQTIPMPFIHNFAFNLAVLYRAKTEPFRIFFTESGYFLNPAASFYYFVRDQKDPDGIGPGLGFATSPEACRSVKAKHFQLGLDDIYGFAYDGERNKLRDVTKEFRAYLSGDETAKAALYP